MTEDGADHRAPADPLVALTDDARMTDAIRERQHRRALREQAADTGTLAGTLLDLAEAATVVGLGTTSGRRHQGRVVGVAHDHVALRTPRARTLFVMLDAIAVVQPEPTLAPMSPTGDRDAAQDLRLLERCADWLDERPWLVVALRNADGLVRGRLHAVGEDVLTLHPDGDAMPCLVAATGIEAVIRD